MKTMWGFSPGRLQVRITTCKTAFVKQQTLPESEVGVRPCSRVELLLKLCRVECPLGFLTYILSKNLDCDVSAGCVSHCDAGLLLDKSYVKGC